MPDDESQMGCIPYLGILVVVAMVGICLTGLLIQMNNAGMLR